ncbi:MAG TPA: TolC family protein [Candidatus Dormibacteraeota bacterium]|nr:TolC family protein [Candidatus Dormibacteraeota bacterium]
MLRPALPALAALLIATASAATPLPVEECVRLALARAPSTQAAAADLRAAQARVRAARAAYWPRLTGQAQYGHAEGYDEAITNGGVTALGIAVEAPLLDGGLRAAELAAARARVTSARALARQREADVAFAVRSTYFAALAEQANAAIYRQAADALANYEALLQRQIDLGLAPSSDLPRAALALETARSAVRAADSNLGAATEELSELTAVTVDSTGLIEPAATQPLAVGDDAIDESPVLADARAAAEAARHDADAARSEGRGHLALNADGGFLGVDPGPTFRNDGGGQFLFGFSIPLFDGGAIAARTAAATAVSASAEANVGQVRQDLAIALTHARADSQRARADAIAWRRAQPAADDALLLMRARYFGGGGATLVDVLDALDQTVSARVAVARARLDEHLAAATVDQLLGRSEP